MPPFHAKARSPKLFAASFMKDGNPSWLLMKKRSRYRRPQSAMSKPKDFTLGSFHFEAVMLKKKKKMATCACVRIIAKADERWHHFLYFLWGWQGAFLAGEGAGGSVYVTCVQ